MNTTTLIAAALVVKLSPFTPAMTMLKDCVRDRVLGKALLENLDDDCVPRAMKKADAILSVEMPSDLSDLTKVWAKYEEGDGIKDRDLTTFLRIFTLLENALSVLMKADEEKGFYTVYFRWIAQEEGRLNSIARARGCGFIQIIDEIRALRNEPLEALAMVG